MKQSNSKNRLFEIMSKVDKTFKPTLNEELTSASDGGYYNKPENKTIVSNQEAEHIKKISNDLYNQLFSGEMIAPIYGNSNESNLKMEIINNLKKSGINIDYDTEEGNDYFWIANDEDIELAKKEFQLVVDNLYDKIDDSMNEIFGLSQGEKNQKILVQKIQQAKNEISKSRIGATAFGQPGTDSSRRDIDNLMKARLNLLMHDMPALIELLPKLFDANQGYTNATFLMNNSNKVNGYILSNWSFAVDNDGYVRINSGKEFLLKKLDGLLQGNVNEDNQELNELNPEEVLNSYLETALWAEGSDNSELNGKTIYDFDEKAKQVSLQDIQNFIETAQQQAPDELANYNAKSLGHYLWLSRNGHGAGFFDDNNDILQNIARAMKTLDIYVGDDGKVHIMGTEQAKIEEKLQTEAGRHISVNPKYTHFAVLKDNNKIINGWDYKGYDQEELRQFKKDYFLSDIKDMQIDPKIVKVLTGKKLISMGINPFDWNNWLPNEEYVKYATM